MGEHGHHTILGFDRYSFNFWILMIFTAIEVVAVALTFSMRDAVSMGTVVGFLVGFLCVFFMDKLGGGCLYRYAGDVLGRASRGKTGQPW